MNANNVVVLCGRLGADPRAKVFDDGTPLAAFSIAVDRIPKTAAKCDWIDVEAYGKTAEFVNSYLKKGSLVSVVGELRVRDWQATDGSKRRSISVRADSVQHLQSPRDESNTPRGEPRTAADEAAARVASAFQGAREVTGEFDPFGDA